jgi:FtsH-binding integral membrane protein
VSFNSQQQSFYPDAGNQVAPESVAVRAKFIERTYVHLAGAIAAFVGLEYAFFQSDAMLRFGISMAGNWWLVLIVFMAVSWIADYFARHATSRPMQYLGLGLYVVAEAIIFLPMLMIAQFYSGPQNPIIMTAGVSTLAIFAALTGVVLVTKKDFSWLRGVLILGSLVTLGLIVASLIFGFTLGLGFTVAMIFFAAAWILYDTSNVLRHYHPESYVAASLALFSSVALLFWYILRFVMQMSRD